MEELEEKLSKLPKPKLKRRADFKIKIQLVFWVYWKKFGNLFSFKLNPWRLAAYLASLFIFLGAASFYVFSDNSLSPPPFSFIKKSQPEIEKIAPIELDTQDDTRQIEEPPASLEIKPAPLEATEKDDSEEKADDSNRRQSSREEKKNSEEEDQDEDEHEEQDEKDNDDDEDNERDDAEDNEEREDSRQDDDESNRQETDDDNWEED